MRVDQPNINVIENVKQNVGPEAKETNFLAGLVSAGDGAIFSTDKAEKNVYGKSINVKDATYLKPGQEEKKSVADALEQNGTLDAAARKEQMVVLSNTTSAEDYVKMQENGFSLDETTSNTIVTVTDEIKAELAKAGVDISVFGDDLSMEQLLEIAGSPEMASQLAQTMQKADLPCTEENMKDAMEAIQMAGALQMPSDAAIKYLVDNQMSPTIENLYKAEYSGNYRTSNTTSMEIDSFMNQVEKVICQAGLPVNEQTVAESKWMLENNIPLNEQNLQYVDCLRGMTLPMDEQTLMENIATAISEGARPQDAMMLSGYTMDEQAANALAVVQNATDEDVDYLVSNGMELNIRNLAYASAARMAQVVADGASKATNTVGSVDATGSVAATERMDATDTANTEQTYTKQELAQITARRQLEEIRLLMTTEANLSLLKRGIQIDTQPLAQLVEELKATENNYYENLLKGQGVEASEENVAILKETTETVSDLKSAPAYVLGMTEIKTATVNEVYEAAEVIRDRFSRANERYETLMTAPRADLGDSIQKAFRNVDEILSDLNLEITETNQRAVRILGYNEIAITEKSIAQIKAADAEVQRAFRNLTPSTVIEMIHKGINPLDMDFTSLNEVAEQIANERGTEDTQKFSEFLWKLEQNNEITEEERASYVGTYRLIHQIEKTDGAVIGALINQGADITMRNLMTAVRSARHSGSMDYSVDDKFGERNNGGYITNSITEQVATAYQNNCMKDVADELTPDKMQRVMMQDDMWENMTPEQLKEALQQADVDETQVDVAYAKEQLQELAQSAKVSENIYAILEKYDIPNTVSNILAMEAMVKNRNGAMRQLFGSGVKDAGEEVGVEDIETMKQEVLDAFGEAISEPEEMAKAQEKLGILAENVMRGVLEGENVTSIDVRQMKLLSAQLSIQKTLLKDEQYSVPVMTGDGVVNVSLKIVRGVDKKGVVDITMESALRGKISATFQAKEHGVTGLVATDKAETTELLKAHNEELLENLQQETSVDIRYAYVSDLEVNAISMASGNIDDGRQVDANDKDTNYQAQTSRLYRIAETFIRQMREVL